MSSVQASDGNLMPHRSTNSELVIYNENRTIFDLEQTKKIFKNKSIKLTPMQEQTRIAVKDFVEKHPITFNGDQMAKSQLMSSWA